MRRSLLIGVVVVLAAIVIGSAVTWTQGASPFALIAVVLQGPNPPRPTAFWTSPTPKSPPTPTLPPTRTPTPVPYSTPAPTSVPPMPIPTATPYLIYYSVQPGDTLESIAAAFGMQPNEILGATSLRPLPDTTTLFPGLVIAILNPRSLPQPAPAPTGVPTGAPANTPTVEPTATVAP